MAAFCLAVPFGPAATAAPEPTLKELAARAERMHTEIEQLSEEFNRQRIKLKSSQQNAAAARKTLSTRRQDLTAKRQRAATLAQSSYISGGLERAWALTQSEDPSLFLNNVAATSALEEQHSRELKEVSEAITAAERAERNAAAQIAEMRRLVTDLGAKREKITNLVDKVESSLFRRALGQVGSGGATRVNLPIIGRGKAAEAARWALTQQLKPYVWGAEGPSSYDCSGLVMAAYQQVGINLPHYTGDQWTSGRHISRAEIRPGDLVFFYSDLHHVGIYVGGGMMVHAPRTGDVVRLATIANRPWAGAVRIAG